MDTAWIEIERESALQAGLIGVSLDVIDPYHIMDVENGRYLVVGLPSGFYTLTDRPDDEDNTPLMGYFTIPGIQANEMDDRLFLDYERNTVLPSGEVVDLPEPGGISGGPIWLIPDLGDNEIWSPHKYSLVGFNIIYSREQVIGLRMYLWLRFVEDDHPELRRFISPILAKTR